MHLHFDLTTLLAPVLLGAAVSVGNWIAGRFKSPTDHERAVLLAHIADGAAALVFSLNPKGSWNDLLKATITAIESAAGLPTSNNAAIQRSAAAALVKLGKPQA